MTITRTIGSADAIVISCKCDYYVNMGCTGNVLATWQRASHLPYRAWLDDMTTAGRIVTLT